MIADTDRYPREYDSQYSQIYAGVSWPGANAGWVVVVGQSRMRCVRGRPVLTVLDETTSEGLADLVQRLLALVEYYRPERLLGDAQYPAAWHFLEQLGRDVVRVEQSLVLYAADPLAYMMPILGRLYVPGQLLNRLEIPETSGLVGELLAVPKSREGRALRLADYPGVEALGHAVLGLELRAQEDRTMPMETSR